MSSRRVDGMTGAAPQAGMAATGRTVAALSWAMMLVMGGAGVHLLRARQQQAEYGRYSSGGRGGGHGLGGRLPYVGARLAWALQELPALLLPLLCGAVPASLVRRSAPNAALWLLFLAHYAYRWAPPARSPAAAPGQCASNWEQPFLPRRLGCPSAA